MASKERLYELWMLYFTKKDPHYLQQWLEAFVTSFERIIDVSSYEPLQRRPEEMAAEIPLLPGNVLQVLSQQLSQCVQRLSTEEAEAGLGQALLLIKFLIIICRNLENIEAKVTPTFIPEVVNLLAVCTSELKKETQEKVLPESSKVEQLMMYALHLCECLFDPYQIWRRHLGGEIISSMERSKYKFAPAILPQEFNTFFHESFKDSQSLPKTIHLRLIYLYGAIISGSKQNALLAITPTSIEVLMLVLRTSCDTGTQEQKDTRLLQVALKCLIGMIHILHASSLDQRRVTIKTILDSYFKLLNADRPVAVLEGGTKSRLEDGFITLRINMLSAISEMLNCKDRPVLQAVFLNNNCFEHVIRLIQNSKLYVSSRSKDDSKVGSDLATQLLTEINLSKVFEKESDSITVHAIRVLTAIMKNSPSAKEVFKERIGYSHLYEVLKSQGEPTKRLLQELMNMAIEDENMTSLITINNEQPLLILVQWIPDLESRNLQIFVSDWLKKVCGATLRTCMTCVKAGMLSSTLASLGCYSQLDRKCGENLIDLLEVLGSLSIQPGELCQLIKLLRTDDDKAHPYSARVIRALSAMARKDGSESVLQYFDLTPSMAGIMVPIIQKWPGNGFAFHTWLCLNEEREDNCLFSKRPKRKQLYSFFTASGTGFEAFFTSDGMLVVAVCTKKEYMTVALPEFSFSDSLWHCIDIIHIAGRRPFGQNVVNIYADGSLRKTAQLRFPSLNEPFTYCCIGSAGHRTTTTVITSPTQSPELSFTSHTPLNRSQSFPASFASPMRGSTSSQAIVNTIMAGTQDTEWGTPTSLEGQMGSVFVFHEALQPVHVKAFFNAGPNNLLPFKPDSELSDLSSKLLLHYSPKACRNQICLDLSTNHLYDGRLTGHNTVNWDIKDVINCMGGMGILLPLLEQVASKSDDSEENQETTDLVGPELTSSQNIQGMLLPLGKSSESKLERNSVAAFLLLVKNLTRNHTINQENFIQCNGPAVIGALLQKVPSHRVDMNVLMACQFLMEQAASEGNNLLLHYMYQYLLFDFRIWSHSDFAVRLGHIQYLSTIIKDHKQRIRKRYGVQYILDSIRTHYGPQKDNQVTADVKTVQLSLFNLVKDFITKAVSAEELHSIISYMATANDDDQLCGILDVLLSLLKGGPSRDQLYTLLFDPGNVEVFYSLILQKKYSDEVREKIFRLMYKMLKYEKVHERCKLRLKLKDIGYQGLTSFLNDFPASMSLIRCLSEQVLCSDPVPNYKDLIAVVYLSHKADLTVRLDVCRKLFHLIYSQQDIVRQLAKQAGWQDNLTKLYVKESYESREASLSSSFNSYSIDLLKNSDQSQDFIQEQGKELINRMNSQSDFQDSEVFLPFNKNLNEDISEGQSDLSMSPSFPSSKMKSYDSFNFKSFDSLDRTSHSSTNTIDIPGSSEAILSDISEDAFYQPLSPFTLPSFDLGTEMGSTSSFTTMESGNLTPVSTSETPSPLENFKPFPGIRTWKSSSLSNVLDDSSYQENLPSDDASNTSNPQQTPEEELCNLLTNIIFSVTWRGVEGSEDAAWKERGQIFSVLTKLGTACELVRPPDEIKRSLLEMMLESAFSDIKDATNTALTSHIQNILKLLRLLQDFLFSEGQSNQVLWSEKILEGVINLLDKLAVWHHSDNGTSDLKEMAQIGLRIILGYIVQEDTQVCAMACVKLHSLLKTMPIWKEEACFLLGKLDVPLTRSIKGKTEIFSYLLPIVRTLMDQCYQLLQLQYRLPSLPPTNGSPTFFEDFQHFCVTTEWRLFMERNVLNVMTQYELDTFARSHNQMSNFWNSCYDSLMSSSLRREHERGESRSKFQELMLEPYLKRVRYENARYNNILKQITSHHSAVLRQWQSLRRLFTCQRGAWAERNPIEIKWKLASVETYSRMRLKLVPNYSFDKHAEASALRDNLGTDHARSPPDSLPLAVAKKAKVNELEDDQLEDEDLVFLNNQVEPEEPSQKEKLVISEECELITIVAVIPGRLEITTQHIYFYDGSIEKEETEEGIGYDFKRPLSHLREVHLRRYNLRRSALEFFFIDRSNYFVNFKKKVRNKVYSRILWARPTNLFDFNSRSPQELLKASGLTQEWVQRKISNFEYLMKLNTIAGRTYNDLSQYPVFPWIICDYTSEELDLNNPNVFRDLSRPIGVVNDKHAKDVKEKYESFEDPTGAIDKFHYGTHYSNAAGVMHYMIRTEPFTTLHIQLQSGRFDCADRQFHSIPAAWQVRIDNPVDVKELTPEFFYFPEFLENQNGFDLGCLQMTSENVADVVLPKWAKSPEDFIYKHRKALESEYVSTNLHNWIDLIFGYKQRGSAAVEALNVFYYCTYEGAVDLDAIADETERKALEGIISNFGQTPCQLLKEPHPPRLTAENAARRLGRFDYAPNVFEHLGQLKPFYVEGISDDIPLVQALVPKKQADSYITPYVLVTVSMNGLIGTHGWLPYDKKNSKCFTFTRDPIASNVKTQRFLSGPFAPGVYLSPKILAVSPDGKLLFSGGHWDNSLRVTSLSKGKVTGHIIRHIDIVTCLALDHCGIYLISGSRDTTCIVWQVIQQGGFACGLSQKPVQVLYGHDNAVTCVAISTELDMAVSGSKDGTVIVHTVRRGQFMRTLKLPCESTLPMTIDDLVIGCEGQIVIHSNIESRAPSRDKMFLHLYSVNGKHLVSVTLDERVSAMCIVEEFVVLGTEQCSLEIRDLQSLKSAMQKLVMKVPIHCVSITKDNSHILVGLNDGKLIVVASEKPSEIRSSQFARRLWSSTRRISQVSSGETEYNKTDTSTK
ncbi:neurobeachin-like protein 2 isoform X1 [Carcharodon carcharias]|uniref:neurobeachin-like protein 2 isoform X1 n=1 Tax=Carcharodon carcharias TaxID=13397 RepID=UPI001B7DEDCF|nr:neurobeachin-like protein 2 isoform X1 [Carcharodon carcharias]